MSGDGTERACSDDAALERIHATLERIYQQSESLKRPLLTVAGQLLIGLVVAYFGYMLNETNKRAILPVMGREVAMWVDIVLREDEKESPAKRALASVYNDRALLYDELGRHDDAIDDLDRAIQYDPDSPYWYSNRGNIKLRAGDCGGAIDDLQHATALFGQNDPEAKAELVSAREQCE